MTASFSGVIPLVFEFDVMRWRRETTPFVATLNPFGIDRNSLGGEVTLFRFHFQILFSDSFQISFSDSIFRFHFLSPFSESIF